KTFAGKEKPTVFVKIFGVVLSYFVLEFPLKRSDYFVERLRARRKIIGIVDKLLVKINMDLRHPLVVDFQPLLRFHLACPHPIAVQIEKIMVWPPTGPRFVVLSGVARR